MNLEVKFCTLKGYIGCTILILNSKVDLFIELLKETITKIEKRERNNIEFLQENIRFLQKEVFSKNDLIKSLMKTQTAALEAITNLKEKPQDQKELSNVTYKQQIQQNHQGQQNNQQKIPSNSRITTDIFKIRGNSSNYKNNKNNNKMENNNSNIRRNNNIKLGSSNINNINKNSNNNNKNYIAINQKQSL